MHLQLLSAALWEVDRTSLAQQCCSAVLQRGFLVGGWGSIGVGVVEHGVGVVGIFSAATLAGASCALAPTDLWAAAVISQSQDASQYA